MGHTLYVLLLRLIAVRPSLHLFIIPFTRIPLLNPFILPLFHHSTPYVPIISVVFGCSSFKPGLAVRHLRMRREKTKRSL